MIDFELPGKPGVGTGPFKATADPATIEGFDKYYLGAPTLKRVRLVEYDSQRAAWSRDDARRDRHAARGQPRGGRLRRGRVQCQGDRSSSGRITTASCSTCVIPCCRSGRCASRSTRLSIVTAIVRVSMRGQGRPASGPVWPLHWAYSTSVPDFTYEPDRAAKRLDALGYTVGRSQRTRTDAKPVSFQVPGARERSQCRSHRAARAATALRTRRRHGGRVGQAEKSGQGLPERAISMPR